MTKYNYQHDKLKEVVPALALRGQKAAEGGECGRIGEDDLDIGTNSKLF